MIAIYVISKQQNINYVESIAVQKSSSLPIWNQTVEIIQWNREILIKHQSY